MSIREEQKSQFDESQEQLRELDFTKDIYSPSEFASRQVKPRGSQSYVDDIGDEVMLTWIGQLLDKDAQNLGDYDETFDRNFNPFEADHIEGYEEHAEQFMEVRNQGHMDYLKHRIDVNKARYERLEASPDRTFGPALIAGLFDPINYIPVPFVGGMSFATRALKGGAAAGVLVGATEPVRQAYNPLATTDESIAYVGTSFVLGGVLSGLLAPRVVNSANRAIAKKHITDKGGPEKLETNYHNAMYSTEGGDPSMFDGLVIRAQRFDGKIKLTEDLTIDINVGRTGRYFDARGNYTKDRKRGVEPAHIFIKTNKGKTQVLVDEVRLKQEFNAYKKDGVQLPGVSPNISKLMKSYDQYVNFRIKKELWKKNQWVEKRKKGESLQAYDQRVTKAVVKDSKKQQGSFVTDVGDTAVMKQFLTWLDKYTDTGKVVHKFKNHPAIASYLARDIFEIAGDFGTVQRGHKTGIRMNPSVHLTVQTTREAELQKVLHIMNEKYVEYRTGSKESKYMFGGNRTAATHKGADWLAETKHSWATNMAKMRNKMFGLKEQLPDRPQNTWNEFQQDVSRAVMDDKVLNDPKLPRTIRESALATRKYFKEIGEEANELGMFANQKTVLRQLKEKEKIKRQIQADLRVANLTPIKKQELEKLLESLGDDLKFLKEQEKLLISEEITPLNLSTEYYSRFWNREEILKHEDAFKNVLRNYYKAHRVHGTKTAKQIDDMVDFAHERILDQSASMDTEGIIGLGTVGKGQGKAGVRGLMSRNIELENKELMKEINMSPDGIPFIETNVSDVLKIYKNRMTTAIELTKRFGDRHMMNHTYRLQRELILNTVESKKDITAMNEVLNAMQDAKDKLYGTFNTQDPAYINKQAAGFLRNIVSFASMGKVVFTAQADMGRPIMVHGFGRVYSQAWRPMMKNPELFKKIAKDAEFINPLIELTQQMSAAERYYGANMGPQNATGGFFNKHFYQPAQKGQGIWYWMNGLTPWTIKMKQMTTFVSQHRFLEDVIKLNKGSLDEAGKVRLASYGIDEPMAKLIGRMPYEQMDGTFLPNARRWRDRPGGAKALSVYRSAVKADVERTIITPSPNDKLNMMYGVVRINNDEVADAFDNPVGRYFGFTRTDRGGKFQNAYMALPFQFYSWMIAANRKLLMSGVAGRDQYLLQGGSAMVGFAIWGDFLKSPDFWYQKPFEEKILTGVEKSGVGAILSDLPHMLETVSGQEYGIRPMLGMDDPYGQPEDHDAFRPIVGAAGSNLLDIYYAFEDGGDKEQRDAIRRMIPLNNWFVWDRAFKKVYNGVLED